MKEGKYFWQSWVEVKHYFFDHITTYSVMYTLRAPLFGVFNLAILANSSFFAKICTRQYYM